MNAYQEYLIQSAYYAALAALTAPITDEDQEEAANYHEEQMRGWMNDIDQEDRD